MANSERIRDIVSRVYDRLTTNFPDHDVRYDTGIKKETLKDTLVILVGIGETTPGQNRGQHDAIGLSGEITVTLIHSIRPATESADYLHALDTGESLLSWVVFERFGAMFPTELTTMSPPILRDGEYRQVVTMRGGWNTPTNRLPNQREGRPPDGFPTIADFDSGALLKGLTVITNGESNTYTLEGE